MDTHNVTFFIVTKVPETTSGYAYILIVYRQPQKRNIENVANQYVYLKILEII